MDDGTPPPPPPPRPPPAAVAVVDASFENLRWNTRRVLSKQLAAKSKPSSSCLPASGGDALLRRYEKIRRRMQETIVGGIGHGESSKHTIRRAGITTSWNGTELDRPCARKLKKREMRKARALKTKSEYSNSFSCCRLRETIIRVRVLTYSSLLRHSKRRDSSGEEHQIQSDILPTWVRNIVKTSVAHEACLIFNLQVSHLSTYQERSVSTGIREAILLKDR